MPMGDYCLDLTSNTMRLSFALETAKVLVVLLVSVVSLFMLLLIDSLLRGWWQCHQIRSQNDKLPPALPLELLRMTVTTTPSSPSSLSIQNCFAAAEQWFRISKQWSLEILPGFWCFRRFVLIANDELLKHVLVTSNQRYEKHHAHGVLEQFRLTTLPTSGVDAWKETHRYISKFGKALPQLEPILSKLVEEWIDATWGDDACTTTPPLDTAETLRDMYWRVVMILVLGKDDHWEIYRDAWTTCMERLDSPEVFLFWWAQYLPTRLNFRYKRQTAQLRNIVRCAVDKAYNSPQPEEWTFLKLMAEQSPSNRLSREDATEVLLEILFTGASSVTTTLLWLLWHLATHLESQARAAQECCNIDLGSLLSSSPPKMVFLESCIRETLRLYSPIHVGRHCIEDDQFGDIVIPKGTDVAANMWFIHRSSEYWPDPSHFDPERWLDKPTNVAYYHPFSMGMRACPGKAVAYTMIKYVVARILTRLELTPMPDMPSPAFSGSVVLSNTPIQIYLNGKPRQKVN